MSNLDINSLNDAQREAVLATEGPLLVLAGAGSGKTRVLTYRIAHMIEDLGVNPWQILAITFTNKAANEMKDRLSLLLEGDGFNTRGMWVSTFHSMCVRMLRDNAERIGYRSNFSIYDDSDSKTLVKHIMHEKGIDTKYLNGIRSKISDAKNKLIMPQDLENMSSSLQTSYAAQVYFELQHRLKSSNAMDFDDLLINAYELLQNNPDVLQQYQERFEYISVDEYQDTNHVQYLITNLLAHSKRNLMVVGDDDQSIYSWRGADISNILDFQKDYPEAKVIKLQENYRSTGHILSAASAVVANNSKRQKKTLYTQAGDGEKICVYAASDEKEEGRWIASKVEKLHNEPVFVSGEKSTTTLGGGISYDDMAVFYRTNAQSRVLEDMFLRAGVPYKIVGGVRFYDRQEIRDVMAYLKLVVNSSDDVSARRVINVPRRGIGSTSVDKIADYAVRKGISFFDGASACSLGGALDVPILPTKTRAALSSFVNVINSAISYRGDLDKVIGNIIDSAGIIASLEAEQTTEAEARIENIKEFLKVASEFDPETQAPSVQLEEEGADVSENESPLPDFMEWLALRTDLDSLSGQTSAVTMMTIHSAKGLEFPVVFVAGMEEGLFPNMRLDGSKEKLEEERRLAYVAITRAKSRLFLTYASERNTYGEKAHGKVSRFIEEIPEDDIKQIGVGSSDYSGTIGEKRGSRHGMYGSGYSSSYYGDDFDESFGAFGSGNRGSAQAVSASPAQTFTKGDRISHKVFGNGVVLNSQGDKIDVLFEKGGKTKKLITSLAPIVKIN